jgi:hypothetical protein
MEMVQHKDNQQMDGQVKKNLMKVAFFWDVHDWTVVVVAGCSFDREDGIATTDNVTLEDGGPANKLMLMKMLMIM